MMVDKMTEEKGSNGLREKILAEMTSSYTNALDKNFELAKKFIRITSEGFVEVLVKDKISGKEQILLYLIGKVYAKEAGLSITDEVENNEILRELGIPMGSLLPWLKSLKEENKIRPVRKGKLVNHVASINLIEKILVNIDEKLTKKEVKNG